MQASEAMEEANRGEGDIRVEYNSQWDFTNLAQQFGIFQEWKVRNFSYYTFSFNSSVEYQLELCSSLNFFQLNKQVFDENNKTRLCT